MTSRYQQFKPDMKEDGSIHVRRRDWISKYSAYIHNGDMEKIYEYGRLVENKMIPLSNPDRILTGEVIYHLPTYFTQKLKKIDNDLTKIFFEKNSLQFEIDELTKAQNADLKKIEELNREHEILEERSEDAAAECEDMYSCIGTGALATKYSIEMQIIRNKVAELKPKVSKRSDTLNDLNTKLKSSIEKHKEVRKAFEKAIGELSKFKN